MDAMREFRAARVFDGERFHDEGGTVVVDAGRIVEVRRGGTGLPDITLLPGLIDCHVHLCADAGPGALDRVADVDLDATIDASLRAHLRAGVTTVRDLGDLRGAVLARRPFAADLPTVVASGAPLTSTGGHCWFLGGEVRGAGEMRRAVRARVAGGADVIKVMASGGVLTPGTDTSGLQLTDEELAAAVDEARALGVPVTAHAHAIAAVWQALRAGVDGIEHCTGVTPRGAHIDEDLAAALAASGIALCLTLGSDPAVVVPPEIVEMAARAGLSQAALQDGVTRLHRAGARIVAGSDAGLGPAKPHGILPRTLAEYVDSGMPVADALHAATAAAATACGLGGSKGRIRAGFDADLLLVEGDPRADIGALLRPSAVHLARADR